MSHEDTERVVGQILKITGAEIGRLSDEVIRLMKPGEAAKLIEERDALRKLVENKDAALRTLAADENWYYKYSADCTELMQIWQGEDHARDTAQAALELK